MPDARTPSQQAVPEVFWVTGLPGSGKTVIGSALQEVLHERGRVAVLLDGDELREAFGGIHGYTPDERRYLAGCYARLCRLLASQGVDVVCTTVSMFSSVRSWSRENVAGYREIFVTAPESDRIARRSLYREASPEEVPGEDPAYELPEEPNLVVTNDGAANPRAIAEQILASVGSTRALA